MKRAYFALAGLMGLAACNTPTTSTNTAGTATQPGQPPATPPAADPARQVYQRYRGLPTGQADSVTLLLLAPPTTAGGPAVDYVGSTYCPDGHPYLLKGKSGPTPDSLVLTVTSPEADSGPMGSNGYWRLRRQPGTSDLAGTMSGRPVRLRLVPPAAGELTFALQFFADSAAAFPKEAKSPWGHISLEALVPVGGPEAIRNILADNILRDLRGDTIAGLATLPLPAFYQQRQQEFFKDYREDAAASRPAAADTAGIGSYGPGMSYEVQTSTYLLYQQGNLLGLSYFDYSFSGGAHGNYGSTAASYDLRTGRRLRYADIFRATAAPQLSALLNRAVRPLVGLQPNDPLDKQLMVNKMPVTHNVLLTAGGVLFIYQPYEIASYAQGEVRVFLPMSAVRALLREGLPLPGTSGVAAR